jgi:hypothetical protein
MNKDFCKILIISNSIPNEDNATSITLKNMFSGWPVNQIAVIYTSLEKTPRNSIYPVFHISELKYFNNKQTTSNALINNARLSKSEVKGVRGANKRSSLKFRVLNYIHTLLSSYKALLPYKYSSELKKFVSEFKPDIIYTPLGSIAIMNITCKLSDNFNLPVVPHFMDDWPHTIYEDDFSLFIPCLSKKYFLNKVFKKAKIGLVISDKMAGEYSSEYHKRFFPLMNCIELGELNSERPVMMSGKKIVFSYFGGLHLLRWKTLRLFFELLEKKSALFQHALEFRIYTSDADRIKYQHEFNQSPAVLFCERVSQDGLLSEMKKSNYLIHVEAFDEKIKKYTRLSISTKIPEYLVAQRPIVAIGPHDVASIEYLRNNNCAHVVSDLENIAASSFIENLFSEKYNDEILQNALQLFLKNHNTKIQHQLLRSVLLSQL